MEGTPLYFAANAVVNIRRRATFKGTFQQAKNFGKFQIPLYLKYHPLGMPKIPIWQSIRSWVWLVLSLFKIRNHVSFSGWIWAFGWRLGRLQGCLKHKALAL